MKKILHWPFIYTFLVCAGSFVQGSPNIPTDLEFDNQEGVLNTDAQTSILVNILYGESRNLRKELVVARSNVSKIDELLQFLNKDINGLKSFEPSIETINSIKGPDPIMQLKDIGIDSISKYRDLSKYFKDSKMLGKIEDTFEFYIDQFSYGVEELERTNISLFTTVNEELKKRNIDYAQLEFDFYLNIISRSSACNFLSRRLVRNDLDDEVDRDALKNCVDFLKELSGLDTDSLIKLLDDQKEEKLKQLNEAKNATMEAKETVDAEVSSIDERLSKVNSDIISIQQSLSNIAQADAADKEREITTNMIYTISITLGVFALIMAAVMYSIIRLSSSSEAQVTANRSFTYPIFLELVTVFVLTVTILILGLANKMDNEALAALIGGISGYVLGRIKQDRTTSDGNDRAVSNQNR